MGEFHRLAAKLVWARRSRPGASNCARPLQPAPFQPMQPVQVSYPQPPLKSAQRRVACFSENA